MWARSIYSTSEPQLLDSLHSLSKAISPKLTNPILSEPKSLLLSYSRGTSILFHENFPLMILLHSLSVYQ